MTEKKKLAVVRGIGARYHEAAFYSKFQKFEVDFLSNKPKSDFVNITDSLRTVQLKTRPVYLFDPMSFLGKKVVQRSWVKLEKLEENLASADIIDTYETFHFFGSQCAEFAKRANKPLITNIWMNIPNHPVKFLPPYSFNVKKVIETSTFFILRTQKAADYLLSLGVSPNKMEVIYIGLDLSRFKMAKQDEEKIRILFVGELVESKGIEDLLKVFSRLADRYSNLELWVVGKGRLVNHIISLSRKLPIKYLGYLPTSELPKIYQKCQIFCLPSKDIKYFGVRWIEEMFGYVFVEAMAAGLPIVSTYCGAIPEVIGADNLLVKQGDVQDLQRVLASLINDAKARKKIGVANRARAVAMFDVNHQAEKTERLFGRFI